MSGEPTISFERAVSFVAQPAMNRDEAERRAKWLERCGWKVEWREPGAEFGRGSGLRIVASVYHPRTFHPVGDIKYPDPPAASGGSG